MTMARLHRSDPAPRLGEVITVGGASWMVVSRRYNRDSTRDVAVAACIPNGDGPEGFGRTWYAQDVPCYTIVTEPGGPH